MVNLSKQYIYKQGFIYKSVVYVGLIIVSLVSKNLTGENEILRVHDDQLIIYIELHSVEHSMVYWVEAVDLLSKKSSSPLPAVYLRSVVLLSFLLLFPLIGEMFSNFSRPKLGVAAVDLRTTTGFFSLKWSCTGELFAVW